MIKRTLYFGNPSYLSLSKGQLVLKLPEVEKNDTLPENFKAENVRTIPVEDIGVVVIDNKQITFTSGLMEALLDNNCAVITCDSKSMPQGLMLPLERNTTQSERFQAQIEASVPLKKQLWQQTIQAKIENQAFVLNKCRNAEVRNMLAWVNQVKSGDSDNLEGRAAAYYWKNLFSPPLWGGAGGEVFTRDREGTPPNNLLNYGYAILRAVVARALVASGLLPTLGIHHHNRYNAYCLADDIMEPYRPFVDKLVVEIISLPCGEGGGGALTKEIKAELLRIPVLDVIINGERSLLMLASGQTASSLAKCFMGESRKINYPEFEQ
ncbi:CRISPR-associated endonuclease Cas1 [Bacteroidia bacterium]|nr:CRISPR-associated endonuclease Cas1 [Bacteroidia bacterium]